jgi:microcystin-dependent protein
MQQIKGVTMYRLRLFSILTVLFILFSFPLFSYGGAIPQLLNYQGTLTDTSGNPVPDGQYGVVFGIYDVSTGGNALWTETWDNTTMPITTINGNFSVLLGKHTPLPASFFADHPSTYLGIKIGSDSEMIPRQQISSVAYAFTAGTGVPKGAIIMWSGAIDQIPEGWALCDGSNGTPNLRNRFIIGAGNAFAIGDTGGNATINLQHSHSIGDHTHPFSGTTGSSSTSKSRREGNDDSFTLPGVEHGHSYSGTTSPSGAGFTSVDGNSAQPIMPPYYALAFIIKL